MFEFIIGDIVSIKDDHIVLQNNGIGYKIFTSTNSIVSIELGKKNVMMYSYLNVREDGLFLYGFTSEEEMNMFKLLQMVSKVGPKAALGLLSTLTTNQIKIAILNKDLDSISKAPGIGKKTAERIVLELKDRISKDDINLNEEDNVQIVLNNDYDEILQGLMSLGYTKIEIDKILRKMDLSKMNIEAVFREVLKQLSKH